MQNFSPWIHELKQTRTSATPVIADASTDIVIVGGGIAGVMTAYFLLQNTDKHITLLEGNQIAHGASGHNAGQIVSYFERSFPDISKEFGTDLAVKAQLGLFGMWETIAEIQKELNLKTPISICTGYAGFRSLADALPYIESVAAQKEAGLMVEQVLISDMVLGFTELPPRLKDVVAVVSHEHILNILETIDTQYCIALASKKGCTNSAALCEELITYFLTHHPERFTLHEHTTVERVILTDSNTQCMIHGGYAITAPYTVLCTNGFTHLHIENQSGDPIDASFHETVEGKVGYMAGYLTPPGESVCAISYINDKSEDGSDKYMYITRRLYEYEPQQVHNLICIGGPEQDLHEKHTYDKHTHPFPDQAKQEIDAFLRSSRLDHPNGDYAFLWHGLMGYTKNGLRMIGPDPRNNRLLYNLGCNGVGILPSIYGGKRIADYVQFGVLDESIFDVR